MLYLNCVNACATKTRGRKLKCGWGGENVWIEVSEK